MNSAKNAAKSAKRQTMKQKNMSNGPNTLTKINEIPLEYVNSFIYLGRSVSFTNVEDEVNRRTPDILKK